MADKEKVLFSRGPRATLPSSKAPGTIYITTDTGEMFVDDTATSRVQVGPSPADVRSLGIPSASVGQLIKIKAVDASGKPTAWEAVDMPSGGKPFVVTVTYDDNDGLTADKTHAEIVEAYAAGEQINAKIVNYPGVVVPSILPLYINNPNKNVFIFSGSGVLDDSAMTMTATDTNGSWSVSLANIAKQGDIPTALKNPESLTFTGAASGSYDGSSAMTVNIPSPSSVTAASIEAALGYKPADPANVADRDHTHPANKITAGTFGGEVVANQTAVAILGDAQVRNIKITNVDLIAGTSELASGEVVFVYE